MNLQRLVRLITISEKVSLKNLIGKEGNTKIPSSTGIFNMGSAHDCPSKKLGFCQAIDKDGKNCCYAKKAEYSYHPQVLPYRRRQEEYWKKTNATDFVKDFLIINYYRVVKFQALRLNESGDFWDQASLNKAEEIAKKLALFKIKVYCYTARKDLNYSKIKHLIILGSNFYKKGLRGVFKMVHNLKEKPKGFGICKGNCRVCNRCLMGRSSVILKH
jgi:hypothetical protein